MKTHYDQNINSNEQHDTPNSEDFWEEYFFQQSYEKENMTHNYTRRNNENDISSLEEDNHLSEDEARNDYSFNNENDNNKNYYYDDNKSDTEESENYDEYQENPQVIYTNLFISCSNLFLASLRLQNDKDFIYLVLCHLFAHNQKYDY